MRGRGIAYTAAEETFLRRHARTPRRELTRLFREAFGREDVELDHIKAKCTRMGLKTGRTGRLQPGAVPPNKGRRGYSHPNSIATQFKPGRPTHNARAMWSEGVDHYGYVTMKVPRPNPYKPGSTSRIMQKHRYLWEEEHGPIPKGYVLRCVTDDRADCEPSNWICIPPSLNARLNTAGYSVAPLELRKSILARCRLEDRIGEVMPSPSQKYRALGHRYSRAARPAAHLRELIEDKAVSFNPLDHESEIDRRIAEAYAAHERLVDISDLVGRATSFFIDRKRVKGRPDIRARIKMLRPDASGEASHQHRNGKMQHGAA